VGPMGGLDRCGKSRPPLGFDPRTVQPVASRYTELAIPAHKIRYNRRKLCPLYGSHMTYTVYYKKKLYEIILKYHWVGNILAGDCVQVVYKIVKHK
jgi:hypothetical protein